MQRSKCSCLPRHSAHGPARSAPAPGRPHRQHAESISDALDSRRSKQGRQKSQPAGTQLSHSRHVDGSKSSRASRLTVCPRRATRSIHRFGAGLPGKRGCGEAESSPAASFKSLGSPRSDANPASAASAPASAPSRRAERSLAEVGIEKKTFFFSREPFHSPVVCTIIKPEASLF